MTSKPVSEATFPKLNINGRARLTLLGTGAVFLLTLGFLLLLQSPAQAWTTKYGSCSANSCHGAAATATPAAVISVAINGSPGTTITVAPGSTFEADWMYTNMKYSTNYTATAPEISLPTGWTLASGTANSPSLTGWSSAWDAADGVGWATANSYDTSGEFPNSPIGYTINYNATSWDNGNRNSALDNAAAGDLDGAANKMGTDARITIPVGASPGSYTVMVMGVGHNENNTKAHIEQAITVTVSSGISQTITVGTPAPGSAAYNSQFTVAATATSGLPVTYSSGSTGICTNSGATFTMVSGTGTCIVQYDQAGGSGYNAAPRVTNNVTATKSNQATVTVSAPANATYGQTGLSASASGGSGTGAFSYSAGSSTACTVNSSTGGLTITSGSGTCSITATRATDSNYDVSAASAPATVTIGTATQVTLLVTGPASVTYGSTGSITTSGGSGTGGMSYSHGASTGCTVNPSTGVISVTNASVTCSVTATKAADANYSQATSAGFGVTLNKLTPTLSVSNSPVTYDGTPKSATVNGSVPGVVSSVLTGGAASQTSVGIYAVTANFVPTDSNNYNSLTAASAGSFEIGTGAQATLSVTGPGSVTYGSTGQITYSGGSGSGAMSYSHGASTGCTVNISSGEISVTNASGSCSVTATKAADANYSQATSAGFGVTLNKLTPTLSVSNSPVTYDGTPKSAIVGGSVPGTASSVLTGGAASQTSVGIYAVTANFVPTDSNNYNSLTAASAGSFEISTGAQATLSVTGPGSVTYGSTGFITTSGGSGSGAMSYSHGASTGCTVNPSTGEISVTNASGSCSVTATKAADANYSQATSAGFGVTLNKLTPTLSVTNSPVTYDGTPKSATVNGSVPGVVSSVLTGGAASQTSVGIYAVTANFVPTDSNNYNSLTAASAGSFEISAATQATLSVTGPASVSYGSTGQTTYSGGSGSGAMSYSHGASTGCTVNPSTGVISVTNASGTCSVTATKAADSNYSQATSAGYSVTLNKLTPTLFVTNSPVTYDGSPKSAIVNGSVPGTASNVLTGGAASQTSVGIYAVTADFVPTDSNNYNSLTAASAGSFQISGLLNQATLSVTGPASVTYGSTGSTTTSGGSGSGAMSYSHGASTGCTVNPSSGVISVTNASGTCSVTATKAGDATYNPATSAAFTVTLNKAAQATVTVSAPASAAYGQTGLSASASGGSGSGVYSYSAGSSTACTVNPSTGGLTITSGTGSCSITATRATDSNYLVSGASAPATVTINKATPTVTAWPTASGITFGQTLASSTLNGGTSTPAGTFAFTNPATAPNAGTAPQGVTFTPTDTTNYTTATGTASLTVAQATTTVSVWPTATGITYGQTLASSTLSGGTASTAGSFAFTNPATAPNAGTAAQGVTFTPSDAVNYTTATGTASLTVAQATTTVSVWPTATGITYGQTLASSNLSGGTPSTAGSFAFTNPATAPNAGTAPQGVTFTPTDAINYTTAVGTTSVTVAQAASNVTAWPIATGITYGQTLVSSSLSGGTSTPAGTFAFTNPATSPNAGTAPQGVTFTPTDSANYNGAVGTASVTVAQAASNVTAWPTATGITYGQTLVSSSLSGGTSTPAGTFAFTNPATAPNAGTAPQGVTFTPTDSANYNGATGTVSVTVAKAASNVTAWPIATGITYGQTLVSSSLSGGTSTPAGTFAFTNPATAPNAGTAAQGVTFTPTDSANYNGAVGTVSVTVDRANQTITFEALGNKIYGDGSFTLSATGGASGNPITFISSNLAVATVSGTTVTIVGAGITTITASQTGSANYNAASDQFQALAVDKASQTITFAVLQSKNVGDADFAPGATADSTLPVTYISSNAAVATIVGGLIHVVGAGSADITASQAGNTNYNAAADVIQPLTVTAAGNPTLSVTITGNGSVNSNPSGISCTSGTCSSDVFTGGQLVVLTASTSWNYDFSSWTGPCTVNANLCTVSVNGLTEVIATFTAKQLVMLPGPTYYASMQDAYNSAAEGAVLQGRDQIFTENLVFDRSVNVTFNGGNNEAWTVVGNTTINGTVTMGGVAGGSVTISNLVIQ